jgi:hypothetical protein
MAVWAGVESKCQWLVVRDHVEDSTFKEVSEMLDGQINGQKFTIKGAIPPFGRFQLLREK